MANEKVSQLNSLTAAEMSSDDIFLVGDVSAKESKKMTSSQLLLFIESSGSFAAYTATTANTASYILGSNVDGAVATASYVASTISSSHALRADSASIADTASYVNQSITSVATSSYLQYSGFPNGTSSYSLISNTAANASQSAFLVYIGGNNGTASFAMTASNVISASYAKSSSVANTASFATTTPLATSASYAVHSSTSDTASYAANFNSPVKAWAMVTWSYGATYSQPQLYLQSNVGAVSFVNTWNYSSTHTWINYGITFTNPLLSSNYVLFGQAFQPYQKPEKQDVIFHPVYSNRTTASCTMSIAIDLSVSSVAVWFNSVSASLPNGENTYITFQILG